MNGLQADPKLGKPYERLRQQAHQKQTPVAAQVTKKSALACTGGVADFASTGGSVALGGTAGMANMDCRRDMAGAPAAVLVSFWMPWQNAALAPCFGGGANVEAHGGGVPGSSSGIKLCQVLGVILLTSSAGSGCPSAQDTL